MQAKERERHRERREHLYLRQVGDAIRREAEQQAGDEGRVAALREFEREQVRAYRAQGECQQKDEVVGRLRADTEPLKR